MEDAWTPSSWRSKVALQQPEYKDEEAVKKTFDKVSSLPPLVTAPEVNNLKRALAEVAEGRRFVQFGGDCAERFDECSSDPIEKKIKILLQMSLILTWGARIPTVRIGRMAGQYAKPRSSPTEVVDGKEYPSFRGDNINSFDLSNREHDPERLIQGYFHSAATLNYCRSLLAGGFADLHTSSSWDLGFVKDLPTRTKYAEISSRIKSALDFMEVCGLDEKNETIRTVDHFVSHEGLTLMYEEAMTRRVGEEYYNLGAHVVWLGDRTRQLDGAHVEYLRGIKNPVGVKVGPTMKVEDLVPLIKQLWPDPAADPGKVVLITRLGAGRVRELLPAYVRAVQEAGLPVVWTCDPMHGNTEKTETGYKTRRFDNILSELRDSFAVHTSLGSHLGGVHFELTGEDVTECIGGPERLTVEDLSKEYTTYCDPRLNYAQSMEMAFLIAELLQAEREKAGLPVSSPLHASGSGAGAAAGAGGSDEEPVKKRGRDA